MVQLPGYTVSGYHHMQVSQGVSEDLIFLIFLKNFCRKLRVKIAHSEGVSLPLTTGEPL